MKNPYKTKKYIWCLGGLILFALLVPLVANEVPLMIQTSEGIEFPFLNKGSYRHIDNNHILWRINPIILRQAGTIFSENAFIKPLHDGYVLGSDSLGRDVLLGILYGLRISLLISLLSVFISGLGALVFGSIAGYYGNTKLVISRMQAWTYSLVIIIALYFSTVWAYIYGPSLRHLLLWLGIPFLFFLVNRIAPDYLGRSKRIIRVPLDGMVIRVVEILESIPSLFILIALLGYLEHVNIVGMSIIIGFLLMPGLIRLVRGEILKYASKDYVQSAQILNFSSQSILFQQILPNVLGPIAVALSFAAAGSILIESTLSFLGIGLSIETVSWGSLLNESRKNIDAWWLALFPGLAIYGLIVIYHKLGESISKKYHPKAISF